MNGGKESTLSKGGTQKKLTFKDILTGCGVGEEEKKLPSEKLYNHEVVPLTQRTQPRIEGGNIIMEVNNYDYRKVVDELWFSVIGRLILHKGEISPTTLD